MIKSSSTNYRRDISEHLLFDILQWLPVMTLLRFKSICKSWYALICSSVFTAQHFDSNCGKENLLSMIYTYDEDDKFDGYKFCLLSGNKYEVYNNFDCGQFRNAVENSFVSVALSSNGLICLVHSDYQKVVLWNPTTKQLRPLPKGSISYQSCDDLVFFGFGYNIKSNDYKVIRTIVRKRNLNNKVVEVYSLRAGSWRTILQDVVLAFRFLQRPISKNGTCFWISSDNIPDDAYGDGSLDNFYLDEDSLVSFDLNNETFGTMPLPEHMSDFSSLDFLGDTLAFICGLDNIDIYFGSTYYQIWMLGEYGVKESWSKVWKIGPTTIPYSDYVRFPIGFSKNGDYLLLTDYNGLDGGTLYLYNLCTEENEYLELEHVDPDLSMFARYTESLVQLKSK